MILKMQMKDESRVLLHKNDKNQRQRRHIKPAPTMVTRGRLPVELLQVLEWLLHWHGSHMVSLNL